MCVLSYPGRDQGAEAEKPSTQGLRRLHLPGLRPQRMQHRRQVGHLQAHECHKWVFWSFHFTKNKKTKKQKRNCLKKLSCAITQPSFSFVLCYQFLALPLAPSLILLSRLTFPLRARCVSTAESLALCLFLSLLKCLSSFFFFFFFLPEQGVGILLSSSHFLTSCNLSLSLSSLWMGFSSALWLCHSDFPLSLSVSSPASHCLSVLFFLFFFFYCCDLVSGPSAVIQLSHSLLSSIRSTPHLSVCTPSPRQLCYLGQHRCSWQPW